MSQSARSIVIATCLSAVVAAAAAARQTAEVSPVTAPVPAEVVAEPNSALPEVAAAAEATAEHETALSEISATLDRILALLEEQGREQVRIRLEHRLELARDRLSVAERVLVETTREWDALETEGVRLAAHLEEITTQVRASDLDEEQIGEQLDAFNSQTALLRRNLEERQQQVAERLGELARQVEEQEKDVRRWQAKVEAHGQMQAAGGSSSTP